MVDRERFTFARVRILRELADGRTHREIAQRLHLSTYTVASVRGGGRRVRTQG